MKRIAILLGLTASLLATACGEERRQLPAPAAGGAGGGGAGGDGGTGGSSAGGAGGTGGSGGAGGVGGALAYCGDGVVEGDEACDGADLAGATCASLDFEGGRLGCSEACEYDTSGCTSTEECDSGRDEDGDGLVDCDDPDCATTASCPHCGDGRVNQQSEECDGSDNDGRCSQFGYSLGYVGCTDTCTFDTSMCGDPEICGSGEDEDRDGRVDCEDSDCSTRPECPHCGNGVVQQGEACDGALLQSCVDLGFDGGSLACSSSCEFDTTACRYATCGDGFQDGEEDCDDGNLVLGDGCDDSCFIEGDHCGSPWELVLDPVTGERAVDGTTTGRLFDYGATCAETTGVPDAVVSFTAPADGRYYVEVQATWDVVFFGWEGACGGAATLRCMNEEGAGDGEGIEVELAAGASAYFVITGLATLPEGVPSVGNFRVTAKQVHCNDGVIEGWEQCDDGNLVAGDGCGPACRWEGDNCSDAVDMNLVTEEAPYFWVWRASTQRFWPDFTGSCNTTAPRDGVARFQAPTTGRYSFWLHANFDASLYVWDGACGQGTPEVACGNLVGTIPRNELHVQDYFYVQMTAGQVVYLVVDGHSTSDDSWGWFFLTVAAAECGDGVQDWLEECDDGNLVSGDGCSATCIFEGVEESEPNGTTLTATALAVGEVGSGIVEYQPADIDIWRVNVTAGTTYEIWTRNRFSGECMFDPDTVMRLLDSSGTVLAENDDISSENPCSRVIWTATATGPVYIEITTNQTARTWNGLTIPGGLGYYLSADPT